MDDRPFQDLNALETYAEETYSTLMYLTLAALPLHSIAADHVASHIGKAAGITAVLRGLPLLAFPPPANHHSNNSSMGGSSRHGAVVLPLEIMAESGVKQEDVLRHGSSAPGLRDAVFTIATRANDHLITAREMLKNLQAGKDAGHAFEHEGEEGHQYSYRENGTNHTSVNSTQTTNNTSTQAQEIDRAFGVLMQAIPTSLWLERLEKVDFDVFREELRGREWKLPWRAYWGYSRRRI